MVLDVHLGITLVIPTPLTVVIESPVTGCPRDGIPEWVGERTNRTEDRVKTREAVWLRDESKSGTTITDSNR